MRLYRVTWRGERWDSPLVPSKWHAVLWLMGFRPEIASAIREYGLADCGLKVELWRRMP